jgi:phosphonate transport system permease protein
MQKTETKQSNPLSFKRYRVPLIIFIVLAGLVYLSSKLVGFNIPDLIKGFPKGIEVISFMFPPDWSAFKDMLIPAVQTIVMAFLGTLIGAFLSIFFGLAAAANIAPRWIRNTSRFLIALERALPETIIILILVAGLGLGPFPGIMALSIGCIGMLGKLFGDTIEEIDKKVLDSILSTGASRFQVIRFGVLPQILPSIIANTIFRFEINIRLSVILGAVGAGGIGFELYHAIGLLEYQRATVALICILALVFCTERLSLYLRKRVLDESEIMKRSEAKAVLPSKKFKTQIQIISGILLLITVLFIILEINPLVLFTDFHYMTSLLFQDMLPPNFNILWGNTTIFKSMLETLAMAFLGTLIGGSLAFALAFFAADNTAPNKGIRMITRFLLSLERVTPSLIIILIFIIALGIGSFAGTCAVLIGTIGTFGKLFSDAIEHVDKAQIDGIYSTGANKLQAIRFGIIPQALPSIIANWFYALDVNIRLAIALGIFGGGGVGFELYMAMKVLRYKDALAMIFFIIILVSSIEKVSDFFRRRILSNTQL